MSAWAEDGPGPTGGPRSGAPGWGRLEDRELLLRGTKPGSKCRFQGEGQAGRHLIKGRVNGSMTYRTKKAHPHVLSVSHSARVSPPPTHGLGSHVPPGKAAELGWRSPPGPLGSCPRHTGGDLPIPRNMQPHPPEILTLPSALPSPPHTHAHAHAHTSWIQAEWSRFPGCNREGRMGKKSEQPTWSFSVDTPTQLNGCVPTTPKPQG